MNTSNQDLEPTTRLLFVRHGQTESNAARKYMGQTDSPLTDLGRRQADAVARRLSHLPFTALYSSNLGRTMATAAAISSTCAHCVTSDPRLREQDLGRFEGMTADEILAAYPEEYEEHMLRAPDTAAHGGESVAQVRDRAASFIDEIADRHSGQTVVIVTHGGVMATILWHLLDIPYEAIKRTRLGNTGLAAFVRKQDQWTLECWNDTGHLDSLRNG